MTTSPGALRRAGRHVLDQAEHADDIGLGLASCNRLHRAEHGGGAAHVPLHLLHAARWLERDAAGVEAHALADQRHRCVALGPALPVHHHDEGVLHAALGDAEEGAHAELFQRGLAEHLDLEADLVPHPPAFLGKGGRGEHIGGLGHQIAAMLDPGGDRGDARPALARGAGIGEVKRDAVDALGRRFAVLVGRGPVFVEAVIAQPEARGQGEGGIRAARIETVERVDRDMSGPDPERVQPDRDPAAESLQIEGAAVAAIVEGEEP